MKSCFILMEVHGQYPPPPPPNGATATIVPAPPHFRRLHGHTHTHHTRQDSSGRVISLTQRPFPDNTRKRQDIRAPGGIWTHLSKSMAADPHLRLRGHWDRRSRFLPRLIMLLAILAITTETYLTPPPPSLSPKCPRFPEDNRYSERLPEFTRLSLW
jgi:hypothetical protein